MWAYEDNWLSNDPPQMHAFHRSPTLKQASTALSIHSHSVSKVSWSQYKDVWWPLSTKICTSSAEALTHTQLVILKDGHLHLFWNSLHIVWDFPLTKANKLGKVQIAFVPIGTCLTNSNAVCACSPWKYVTILYTSWWARRCTEKHFLHKVCDPQIWPK